MLGEYNMWFDEGRKYSDADIRDRELIEFGKAFESLQTLSVDYSNIRGHCDMASIQYDFVVGDLKDYQRANEDFAQCSLEFTRIVNDRNRSKTNVVLERLSVLRSLSGQLLQHAHGLLLEMLRIIIPERA